MNVYFFSSEAAPACKSGDNALGVPVPFRRAPGFTISPAGIVFVTDLQFVCGGRNKAEYFLLRNEMLCNLLIYLAANP